MLKELRPAIVLLALMTILTGLVYPYAMTGLANLLFPHQAQGSLVLTDGKVIGSELIGQNFASEKYFHGRAVGDDGYRSERRDQDGPVALQRRRFGRLQLRPDVAGAGGPGEKGDATTLKAEKDAPVPVDLVTTSASGLDPDITPAAAEFQVERVAKARQLPAGTVEALVQKSIETRTLGFIGEPHVNVLALNRALDALQTDAH